MHKLTMIMAGLLLTLPLSLQAASLTPEVPKGKGKECVEPTAEMRINHMEKILHQRDKTLREGIRTTKHSLKECIECHNPPAKDGKVARIGSDDHFCSSCHNYAAVTIDCFECHADKPANTNYRHSLVEGGKIPHHANMKDEKVLSKDTLEVFAEKGDVQ